MRKLLFLFILISFDTSAQQTNQELQNLVKQSFDYNPKLKELEQAKLIATTNVDVYQSYRYPTLAADASYAYVTPVTKIDFPFGPGGTVEHFQLQPNNNLNGNLNANYVLLDFGKFKANVDKAREEMAEGDDNIKGAQNQLAAQVSEIYYSLIYLKKAVEVQDSVIGYLEYNKKITEGKLRNGDALQLDVLNIQASIDNENNRKADLQNQLQKQTNMLVYASGSGTEPSYQKFDFTLPNTSIDAAVQTALNSNPDFSIQQHKINAANLSVKSAKADQYPQLSVNGSAGYKNGYLPNIDLLTFNVVGAAALHLPLYSGSHARQLVQLAQENVKLYELGITTLQVQYKRDIANAVADITTNQDHLKYSQTQIDDSQLAKKITASRYKNGIATYLDVENAVTNYQKAQLGYLQYAYQLCVANIELARLTAYKYW